MEGSVLPLYRHLRPRLDPKPKRLDRADAAAKRARGIEVTHRASIGASGL